MCIMKKFIAKFKNSEILKIVLLKNDFIGLFYKISLSAALLS